MELAILVEAGRFCSQYLTPRVGLYLLKACGAPTLNPDMRSLYLQAIDSFFGTACHVGDIAACNTIVRIVKEVASLPENNWSRAMFLEEATGECVGMLLSPPFLRAEVLKATKRYVWVKAALLCASYNAKMGDCTLAEWIISKSVVSTVIRAGDLVNSQVMKRSIQSGNIEFCKFLVLNYCKEFTKREVIENMHEVCVECCQSWTPSVTLVITCLEFVRSHFSITAVDLRQKMRTVDLMKSCFRNVNIEAVKYFGRVLEVKKDDVILPECTKSGGIEKLWAWLETIGFSVADFRASDYQALHAAFATSTGAQWIITKFEMTKEDLMQCDLVASACTAGNMECLRFIFENYGDDLARHERRESIWHLIPAFQSSANGSVASAKIARYLLTRFNSAMNREDDPHRGRCWNLALSQQDVALIRVLCELSGFSVSEIPRETFADIVSECMDAPIVSKEDLEWLVDSRGMTSEESRAFGRNLLTYQNWWISYVSHDCATWIVRHFKLTPEDVTLYKHCNGNIHGHRLREMVVETLDHRMKRSGIVFSTGRGDVGPKLLSASVPEKNDPHSHVEMPSPPHLMIPIELEPTPAEKENSRLQMRMKKKHPERIENFREPGECMQCSASFFGEFRKYSCGDCFEYCVCSQCYSSGKGSHRHGGVDFFYPQELPRWAIKSEISAKKSCAEVVHECLTHYKQRYFVGEIPPNSVSINWQTYGAIHSLSVDISLGLAHAGMQRGQFVGICLHNSGLWAAIDFACIFQSYVSVPISPTLSVDEFQALMRCGANLSVLFLEATLLEKLSGLIPMGVRVVLCNAPPKFSAPSTHTITLLDQLCEEIPVHLRMMPFHPKPAKPVDTLTVVYTSGSTGTPRGAIFDDSAWLEHLKLSLPLKLCVLHGYLPLCHIAGRTDLYTSLFNGGRIVFTPHAPSVLDTTAIVRPTTLVAVPLLCHTIHELYRSLKQSYVGDKAEGKVAARKQIRNRALGGRVCSVKVSSAPVTDNLLRFLRKVLKIPVNEGYGTTEAGSIALNGRLTTPVKLISIPELEYFANGNPPQGEILIQISEARCKRYLSQERIVFDSDGWFHTGDIGEIYSPGCVRVIDRKNNVVKLSGGEFVALEHIEQGILTIDGVHQAVAYADSSKPRTVAIIVPSSRSQMNVTVDYLSKQLNILGLRNCEVPCAFHIEAHDAQWTAENQCLTPAGKLNRRYIYQKYQQIIRSLYLDQVLHTAFKGCETGAQDLTLLEAGGSSFSAVRLLTELRALSIDISFDDLTTSSITELNHRLRCGSMETAPKLADDFKATLEKEWSTLKARLQLNKNLASSSTEPQRKGVLITGAQGFLGSQLIPSVLKAFPSATIYCLTKRVPCSGNEQVKFLLGDIRKKNLGLKEQEYELLQREVDVVIHTAACVNHLLPLRDLYTSNVGGLLQIVELCVCTYPTKTLHYVSSAAVYAIGTSEEQGSGYAQSKWVSDSLLQRAKTEFPALQVFIYRSPLLGPNSTTGKCNSRDTLWRLLHSIVTYRLFPESALPNHSTRSSQVSSPQVEYGITMIPVDACADIISKCALRNPKELESRAGGIIIDLRFSNVSFSHLIEVAAKFVESNTNGGIKWLDHENWFRAISPCVLRDHAPLEPFLPQCQHGLPGGSLTKFQALLAQELSGVLLCPMSDGTILKALSYLLVERRD
ncbi:AMP-binding protein [Pelomyxa schiedti]|nr:AMP-binding protein [Pelomyxa schiedti]